MKIETIYGLEWEYKALQKTKDCLTKVWAKNPEAFKWLHSINKQIHDSFKANNVEFVDLPFKFQDKEHFELFNKILDLVSFDPYLDRIFLYCHISPQDLDPRHFLKKYHIQEENINACYNYFQNLDVLENSELAKSIPYKDKHVNSIPLCHFITGKILNFLFSECDHYYMIDMVKISGAKESIEELRKNRIYESDEGTVYDYTPIWKKTLLKDGISYIWEVFSQAEYDYLTGGASQKFDEILCGFIKKPQPDPRPNIFFGNNLDVSESYVIIRYGTKETKMPFRLLPKYKNLIKKIVEPYEYTNLKTDDEERYKEEERQEAIIGLFNAATTWCKDKGAVPYWLEQKTIWHLGDAFDKVSDVDPETKERKLMERIESKGGSLDELISDESGETKGDLCEDRRDSIDDQVGHNWDRLYQSLEKYPRMKTIIEKERKEEALSPAERKYKERFIKKHKRE